MNNEVTYCEFLFLGEPREVKTSLENAQKLYDSKLEALGHCHWWFKAGSFIGIKKADGNWLITNEVRV